MPTSQRHSRREERAAIICRHLRARHFQRLWDPRRNGMSNAVGMAMFSGENCGTLRPDLK
jgi:hypothetical protein